MDIKNVGITGILLLVLIVVSWYSLNIKEKVSPEDVVVESFKSSVGKSNIDAYKRYGSFEMNGVVDIEVDTELFPGVLFFAEYLHTVFTHTEKPFPKKINITTRFDSTTRLDEESFESALQRISLSRDTHIFEGPSHIRTFLDSQQEETQARIDVTTNLLRNESFVFDAIVKDATSFFKVADIPSIRKEADPTIKAIAETYINQWVMQETVQTVQEEDVLLPTIGDFFSGAFEQLNLTDNDIEVLVESIFRALVDNNVIALNNRPTQQNHIISWSIDTAVLAETIETQSFTLIDDIIEDVFMYVYTLNPETLATIADVPFETVSQKDVKGVIENMQERVKSTVFTPLYAFPQEQLDQFVSILDTLSLAGSFVIEKETFVNTGVDISFKINPLLFFADVLQNRDQSLSVVLSLVLSIELKEGSFSVTIPEDAIPLESIFDTIGLSQLVSPFFVDTPEVRIEEIDYIQSFDF